MRKLTYNVHCTKTYDKPSFPRTLIAAPMKVRAMKYDTRTPIDPAEALFSAVRAFAARFYPGLSVEKVKIKLNTKQAVSLPVPAAPVPCESGLSLFQERILDVLAGRALTADALGAEVGDRSRLFKRGGVKELMEAGLVKNDRRLGGYYRPDDPPSDADDETDTPSR